jgi:hypothetical protein
VFAGSDIGLLVGHLREAIEEKQQFVQRPCACGCGETGDRDFLPGHDVRAIQQRVREHFGGSPLRFIQWVDQTLDGAGTPAVAAR